MSAPSMPKIVIVEDEGLIAADLESRLTKAGYSVQGSVDSAQGALKLIEETSPDLVLMDIRLKGEEDGIQVADLVRQTLDVPVVYLTAYEDNETLQRASQTQAYGYVKKPIATASLKGAIEIALSKHRYERDLREERDWAIASFAAVPHAVLVADALGRVTYLNAQAEELTGCGADQSLGRPIREVLHIFSSENGKPVEGFATVAMIRGQAIALPGNSCLTGSQEQVCPIRGNVAPRWHNGRVDGVVVTITDATLDRFNQEQSRQESKQEALVRMADGVVRHLPGMSDAAEVSTQLLEALPEDSPLRESAAKIEQLAMDAFATTCHLKAFTELSALDVERIMLNEVVGRFDEAFQALEPGFTLLVEPEQMPILGDEWVLLTAIMNILLHARAQMQPGTGLVMDLSRAEPKIGPWVRLRISYSTAAEDAASLERVFEPSWSGASEDLHITHSLVKKMGGLISARLEPGNIIRFEICFPLAGVTCAEEAGRKLDAPAVLMIEPNPEIRQVLHAHFEEHGFNLLEAAGAEEALLLAEVYQGAIQLVIANVSHEGRWDTLTERFAAMDPRMQVLLIDGYVESRDQSQRASQSRAIRHLTKWDLLAWAQASVGETKYALCAS
ncbi:MAG TPA: response regulator [Bryobacteraceae bacterium]|nr:response regulator [Bryobacteraceae bacterium]